MPSIIRAIKQLNLQSKLVVALNKVDTIDPDQLSTFIPRVKTFLNILFQREKLYVPEWRMIPVSSLNDLNIFAPDLKIPACPKSPRSGNSKKSPKSEVNKSPPVKIKAQNNSKQNVDPDAIPRNSYYNYIRQTGNFLDSGTLTRRVNRSNVECLTDAILEFAGEISKRRKGDLVREYLPARFSVLTTNTIMGTGLIAQGFALSGEFCEGDDVIIFPSMAEANIKGVESYCARERGVGQSKLFAMSLKGVGPAEVKKGDVVVLAKQFQSWKEKELKAKMDEMKDSFKQVDLKKM